MRKKRLLTVLLIFTLLFIWGNSLLSRPASAALSDKVLQCINAVALRLGLGENFFVPGSQEGEDVTLRASFIIRKTAHVTEYAVFAALLWLRLSGTDKKRARLALLSASIVGGIDETIQIFSQRGSRFTDVCIDAAGALLGITVVLLIAHGRRNKGKTV